MFIVLYGIELCVLFYMELELCVMFCMELEPDLSR